ncbi:hypothetical protein HQ524_00070 [Candidatus Uhrbacteria bacterium]|nr:hypothetical protein [Candidatus Uhrbacteria bacterium]
MNTTGHTVGFTLIEILLLIATVGILIGIVFLIINPGDQLSETRNEQRVKDVDTILSAAYQYQIDTGTLPAYITTIPSEICETGKACAGFVDLGVLTDGKSYIESIPVEPMKTNINGAGYLVSRSINGRITVEAQFEELGEVITATR